MKLSGADDAKIAALKHDLSGCCRRTSRSAQPLHDKLIAAGFLRNQVHDRGERVGAVKDRPRSQDHLNPLQDIHWKGLQQITDDAALQDLARGASVDEE